MFARVPEHLTDDTRRLADILVDDRTRNDLQEVRVERCRHRACEQRLAGPWRAIEENTFRWLDADPHEQLWVEQRKLNDLQREWSLSTSSKRD